MIIRFLTINELSTMKISNTDTKSKLDKRREKGKVLAVLKSLALIVLGIQLLIAVIRFLRI